MAVSHSHAALFPAVADSVGPSPMEAAAEALPAVPQPTATVADALHPVAAVAEDTAWMLSTALVAVCAILPGLAMFYGSFAHAGRRQTLLLQHVAVVAVVSLVWVAWGYSLAFSTENMVEGVIGLRSVVGSAAKAGLVGVTATAAVESFSELAWVLFQMAFAVLAPCIALTAFQQRMKLSAVLVFVTLWSTLVYLPVTHAVWAGPGSFLGDLGTLDYAGSLVVHISAGFSSLMGAAMLGPSEGDANGCDTSLLLSGLGLLWVGFMALYAGSALAPGAIAAAAVLNAQCCASAAALTYLFLDGAAGNASLASVCKGGLTGLVCIAAGADKVGIGGAACMGALSAMVGRWASARLRRAFGGEGPQAVSIHGIGSVVGHVATGIFSHPHFGGNQLGIVVTSQLAVQSFSCMVVAAYSMLATCALLSVTRMLCGGVALPSAPSGASGNGQ